MKSDMIEIKGKIIECFPGGKFKVELESGQKIDAYISGKLRLHYIRIQPEDKVTVELSPYDLTKGRIVWRNK